MLGLSPWLSLIAVVIAAALARLLPPADWRMPRRALDSNAAPLVLGVLSALLSIWVWGSLARAPVMHDESAYLLQAELFARLRWTGVAPPLPSFFQQLYVLVDPALASKYPPGNSLILSLGVLVGAPGLPVVLMNGVAGALTFVLARRLGGGSVGLLTWLIWQSAFPIMYYHASYISEGVTSLAWLMTWWGIQNWRGGGSRRWLVLAAGAAAWCIITRPLTGVALSLVTLIVVLRDCRRRRAWRELVPALATAMVVLAILPLWSWRTTGNALSTPLASYTRSYVPFDRPGFGATREERPSGLLPRDQWITSAAFYQEHQRHTLRALPATAWNRLTMIDRDAWYEWRGGLRVFAVLGLLALTAEGWIALAAFATQFGLYLSYAHPSWWTMYYLECMPVLAFVTALGIVWFARRLTVRRDAGDEWRAEVAALVVASAVCVAGVGVAKQVRSQIDSDHAYYDAFARVVQEISDDRAVVFVRYGEKHPDGIALVRNAADPARAAVWTVYDRGYENARLLALAKGRTPYVFDEASWRLRRLDTAYATTPAESLRVVPAGSVRERLRARRRR